MPSPQFKYFLLTIPKDKWCKCLPAGVCYIKGQEEIGEGGYEHWQLLVITKRKISVVGCKGLFCREAHVEPSRSEAADQYVWKEESRVAGSQFELGVKPVRRNSKEDWALIKQQAQEGKLDDIPADIYIRYYSTFKKIFVEYQKPIMRGPQEVIVIYGPTGVGKSRMAFDEVGDDYYIKSPLTKWFDGYHGQKIVVFDDYRGDWWTFGYFLRILDRYPIDVEIKGGFVPFSATTIYISCPRSPQDLYAGLEARTDGALAQLTRRITEVRLFGEPPAPAGPMVDGFHP